MNLDLMTRVAQLEQRLDRLVRPEIPTTSGDYTLPFGMYGTDPYLIAAAGYPFGVSLSRTVTIQSWFQACVVATTNSAAHHWHLTLCKRDATVLATLGTEAMVAGTWALLSSTGLAAAVGVADIGLYIYVEKSGSPGTISLFNPAVWVIE